MQARNACFADTGTKFVGLRHDSNTPAKPGNGAGNPRDRPRNANGLHPKPNLGCRPNESTANEARYFKTPLSKAFIRIVATRSRAMSS